MKYSKLDHLDLHTVNSWVLVHDKPQPWIYRYNDKTYVTNTKLEVKIFDFDRSYAFQLGDNPGFKDSVNLKGIYENTNNPKIVLLQIFYNFYIFFKNRDSIKAKLGTIFCVKDTVKVYNHLRTRGAIDECAES